jgi:hypothetical protein
MCEILLIAQVNYNMFLTATDHHPVMCLVIHLLHVRFFKGKEQQLVRPHTGMRQDMEQ